MKVKGVGRSFGVLGSSTAVLGSLTSPRFDSPAEAFTAVAAGICAL